MDQRTAFAHTEAFLRERLGNAQIAAAEFQRKLSRCSLANCRGTCCYDGVPVDDDTATVLQRLSTERRDDFAEIGLKLPDVVIVESEWRGVIGKKTAVKSFAFRSLVADYPAHFTQTACVFHLDDGRCGLQVLSMRDKKHPRYYKPITCSLHPIKITKSHIHLYEQETDPNRLPGYDGYVCQTHCGRTSNDGQPAAGVLREELEFLGDIIGRNLVSELAATCDCGRPQGQCVKGDAEHCPALDEEDCPNCGGDGVLYDCLDGCCVDAESGCEDCAYPCDCCRGKG